MKHLIYLSAVFLICMFIAAAPSVEAASKVYTNTGTLTAISLDYKTIVVEVPIKDGSMTVGGPLVEDAEVKRGGRPAALKDFREGEKVTVVWRYTESGHRILGLQAR